MGGLNPTPPLPASDLAEVSDLAAPALRELAGERILITGATGFFGRWMIESALAANARLNLGIRMVAVSRDPGLFATRAPHLAGAPGLEWVRANLADPAARLPAIGRVDAAVHLATESDSAATLADPATAIEAIAGSTRRTLEWAAASGCARFLFTSSGSVYRREPGCGPLTEDAPVREAEASPSDAYSISGPAKIRAERHCAEFASRGLATVIARGFTFLGPGLPLGGKFAAGNFIRDALWGGPIRVQGDGTPMRSYLYASDMAVWLWTMLARGDPGSIYNLGSEHQVSIGELAKEAAAIAGCQVAFASAPGPVRPAERYLPDVTLARSRLGLVQTVSWAEGLRRMHAWSRLAAPSSPQGKM